MKPAPPSEGIPAALTRRSLFALAGGAAVAAVVPTPAVEPIISLAATAGPPLFLNYNEGPLEWKYPAVIVWGDMHAIPMTTSEQAMLEAFEMHARTVKTLQFKDDDGLWVMGDA